MLDLTNDRHVRFQYDGFINLRTLAREGFGRYLDVQMFKMRVGYFYDDPALPTQ